MFTLQLSDMTSGRGMEESEECCALSRHRCPVSKTTASPPLQPIVLGGNNVIKAIAEERSGSLPSSRGPGVAPGHRLGCSPQSSCAFSHFSCGAAKHQECVHENFSDVINILMVNSLMWANFISTNHRSSLPCSLFQPLSPAKEADRLTGG